MIEISGKCSNITKEWKGSAGDDIKVHAWQVPLSDDLDPTRSLAAAKLTIERNGDLVHSADMPWPLPRGDVLLALQVYTLSTMPRYSNPEFQPAMEAFAERCEGFEEPPQIFWTKGPSG
jgi:hypothetical protein